MKKVITYGTFDLFHQGHYNILKRAKELGDYLIVGVTGESYDLDRGKLNVQDSLVQRIRNVKDTGFADEIIVEEYEGQKIRDVQKYGVDILVVGSDWIGKFDYLNRYCQVIYLERTRNISSTQLREMRLIHSVGLIEDSAYPNTIVTESKYVSGMHVEGVYSEQKQLEETFCKKYELNFGTTNYQEFLDRVSIVWCQLKKADTETVFRYLKTAIENQKHVICNFSHILDSERICELIDLAAKHSVYLVDAIALNYIRLFDQMIWKIKGGKIGEILSVSVSVSVEDYEGGNLNEILYLLLFLMHRLGGDSVGETLCQVRKDKKYVSLYALLNEGEFYGVIGGGCCLKNGVEIVGTKGRVSVPGEWWNMQYFQIETPDSEIERYAVNLEGSGFRYIYMKMASLLDKESFLCSNVQLEEARWIARLMSRLGIEEKLG